MAGVEVPSFIDLLSACKAAYLLAHDEYDNRMHNKVEFQGAIPKRKNSRKMILRLRKRFDYKGMWSSREQKLLAAAYDIGLADMNESEAES